MTESPLSNCGLPTAGPFFCGLLPWHTRIGAPRPRCQAQLPPHAHAPRGPGTPPARPSGEDTRARTTQLAGYDERGHSSSSPVGGARAGVGLGTAAGRPRCVRIRRATEDDSMSAIRRSRPPQRGHASTSTSKARHTLAVAQVRGAGQERLQMIAYDKVQYLRGGVAPGVVNRR